jgi:septation ring formation regulator EzrA
MEDVITDVQREVMINSGNINQLQIDVDNIRYDIHHLSAETNQITSQVNMLEQTLTSILEIKL